MLFSGDVCIGSARGMIKKVFFGCPVISIRGASAGETGLFSFFPGPSALSRGVEVLHDAYVRMSPFHSTCMRNVTYREASQRSV